MPGSYTQMLQLADEIFASKNDPEQLDVNESVLEQLQQLHPDSVLEYADEHGPIAWVLLIPTTTALMDRFLEKTLSEKELFETTPLNRSYDALYLCSAMVLEEYRRKGIARDLVLRGIESLRKDHPIQTLFVWAYTKEGDATAEAIAKTVGLPLRKRI